MNKLLIPLFLVAGIFLSCSKDAPLMMRVQNISGTDFSFVTSAGKDFGKVGDGSTTPYQAFERIVEVPGAMVTANGEAVHAGYMYCASPPPPSLKNGKYTLVISKDVNYANQYDAKFIAD